MMRRVDSRMSASGSAAHMVRDFVGRQHAVALDRLGRLAHALDEVAVEIAAAPRPAHHGADILEQPVRLDVGAAVLHRVDASGDVAAMQFRQLHGADHVADVLPQPASDLVAGALRRRMARDVVLDEVGDGLRGLLRPFLDERVLSLADVAAPFPRLLPRLAELHFRIAPELHAGTLAIGRLACS